ncbi:MAG: hypothetical protein V7647_3190 [Acidobacteriota bacterium]|jgi:hypothetical protein
MNAAWIPVALVLLTFSASQGSPAAQGAPAAAAPALTKAEMTQFLRTAKIIRQRDIAKGVTGPLRLTLTDGTLQHDAAFSTVDEHTSIMKFANGSTEIDFVDSYRYSVAAYKLAESLGLDGMMPVTVERTWNTKSGALSWWVDARWDEGARLKQHIEPPDPEAWNRQMHRMRVFTALVADTDRNLGNVLISADWKLWMIDFTRAFRRTHKVIAPENLTRCDRQLLAALRGLKQEDVEAATKPYLSRTDVQSILARRDQIVAVFQQRVADKGEALVLY